VVKSIKDDIISWSKQVVEKHNTLIDFPTCPYAQQCRIKQTFKVEETNSLDRAYELVNDWINKLNKTKYQIVVIGCSDYQDITPDELSKVIEALNFISLPKNVYLMANHPDTSGDVDFLYENNFETDNEFLMILIQRLDELQEASARLKRVGYYKKWDQEYYDDTVGYRNKLIERISSMRGMKKKANKKNGKPNNKNNKKNVKKNNKK